MKSLPFARLAQRRLERIEQRLGIGYWDPGQALDAFHFFGELKVPRADRPSQALVDWIQSCLEEAVGHGGDGLVGFVY